MAEEEEEEEGGGGGGEFAAIIPHPQSITKRVTCTATMRKLDF